MNSKLFIIHFLLIRVYANINNDLIIDYFNYKRAPSVVGFSCNIIEDDLLLLKDFSKKGIIAALSKLNNKSAVRLLGNTNYWKLGIFLDIRCYDAESISSVFFEASSGRMFDELRYWLILGSDLESVLRVIDDQAFSLSTDFVIAVPSDTENHNLYDAYNMFKNRGGTLNVTFLGNWKTKRELEISVEQTKFIRRANLHRFPLRAMFFKCAYKTKDEPLEDYLNDFAHPTKDSTIKFGFQLVSHLSDIYNFTLTVNETSVWEPGDKLGPLARAIISNECDITGSPLSMNIPRTYLFKYIHQDWPFRTCFIFRNPQPTSIKVQDILKPFQNQIWYLLFLFFSISVTILTMVLRFERFGTDIIHNKHPQLSNSFLMNIGAVCQQGTDMKIKRVSTRIAFFALLLFSLLIYNYYSACVVSARLDDSIFKINDSLIEFGKMRLKMSSEWMVYLEFFLKKPDWETQMFYQDYWQKLPEANRFMHPELGIQLVRKGGFAYHSHPETSYPYVEKLFDNREICELMEVHLARPMFTAFGVTLNSSVVEIVRVGLTKISEVGLRRRQVLRWQYRKPRCRTDILSASSVNIYEFAAHLILLAIGMFLAVAVCIIEIFIANHDISITFKPTTFQTV